MRKENRSARRRRDERYACIMHVADGDLATRDPKTLVVADHEKAAVVHIHAVETRARTREEALELAVVRVVVPFSGLHASESLRRRRGGSRGRERCGAAHRG